jgi:uncharacterized protein (DUF736 family)
MIIGNFSFDHRSNTYAGTITTLTLHRDNVVLRPTNKSGEKEPDYRIVQEDDCGTVEFGALNAAMFLSDRDDTATLVWQRPKAKAPATESEPKASRPSRSPPRNPRLG